MKRRSLALLLSLAAFSVQAQAAVDAATETGDQEIAAITADDGDQPVVDKAGKNSNCIQETGTRIKRRDGNGCNGLAGRSYSKEDIDSTGASDAGDALRLLDPSISR